LVAVSGRLCYNGSNRLQLIFMPSLIVYQSIHHGNTAQVAEAIGQALGARVVKPEEINPGEIAGYELVGLGSGIYHGRHHVALRKLVEKLEPAETRAFFVFSTSGLGKAKYNRELKELLASRGHKVVGDFYCRGRDTYGPWKYLGGLARKHPSDKDLAQAGEFAKSLLAG